MSAYRDALADLLEWASWHCGVPGPAAISRARALLAEAQPQPVKPTDEELSEFATDWWKGFAYPEQGADIATPVTDIIHPSHFVDFLRAVLARWGRTAPVDSPAAERVAHFLREYGQMNGLDPETIYELHGGLNSPRQAPLRVSDLQSLLADLRPAPEPVSVAERLPTAADCDAHERCWWLEVGSDDDAPTHWLPYWALPVPQEQADYNHNS